MNGNIIERGTPIDKGDSAFIPFDQISYFTEEPIVENCINAINIEEFKSSVINNGGYYIARYEASYGNDGIPNSKVSRGNPAFQQPSSYTEGMLWNFINPIDASNVSRKMYVDNKNFKCDLINSYAWDTAILFIQNFSDNKYYSMQGTKNTTLSNTGVNGDEILNINDMASNTFEITTEKADNSAAPCAVRGGFYGNIENNPNFRGRTQLDLGKAYVGFRTILFL